MINCCTALNVTSELCKAVIKHALKAIHIEFRSIN